MTKKGINSHGKKKFWNLDPSLALKGTKVKEVSRNGRPILYGKQWVDRFFITHPRSWNTRKDVMNFLKENGCSCKESYVKKLISGLKSDNVIESKRSSFAQYRLKDLKGIIEGMGVTNADVQRWRLDFSAYLKTLPWDDVSAVHDIRLKCYLGGSCDFGFVDGVKGWDRSRRRKYYVWRRVIDGRRFELRCHYMEAKSLELIVSCSDRPIAKNLEGLTELFELVLHVRSLSCGDSVYVPFAGLWKVTSWHYGRDTVKGGFEGKCFNVTFTTWFKEVARVYAEHDKEARIELIQNPNETLCALIDDEKEKEEKFQKIGMSIVLGVESTVRQTFRREAKRYGFTYGLDNGE